MFQREIEELYYFQSKERLRNKFTNVKQDRKSIMLYDFADFKWVLIPEDLHSIRNDDLDLYNKLDPSKIMFLSNPQFDDIDQTCNCRRLDEKDRYEFEEFHNACPQKDKDQGMVSIADPVVYGCFVEGKIVSVASLWNWGERLSDIGVLTHPKFRNNGYAENVCKRLMYENNKLFIWRCDEKNDVSYNLAKRLGFSKAGMIYSLKKKS